MKIGRYPSSFFAKANTKGIHKSLIPNFRLAYHACYINNQEKFFAKRNPSNIGGGGGAGVVFFFSFPNSLK
jgi:hypothetical protein